MDLKKEDCLKKSEEKISDFDVVGTTQDVVSKTGFNIPTGVASIAVVFGLRQAKSMATKRNANIGHSATNHYG